MKKSSKFISKALLGLHLGLTLSSFDNGQPMSPEMQNFYQQLDPDAKQKFQQLDAEHKSRAMGIIEHYCRSVQECKGHREEAVQEQYLHQMQQRSGYQQR